MTMSFPAIGLLEALVASQQLTGPDRLEPVVDALRRLASAVDAHGIWLEIPSIGGRRVAAGSGSLVNEAAARSAAQRFDLRYDEDPNPIAWASLDMDVDPWPTVRAIELAVGAAWSREELRRHGERLEALDAATRGIAGVLAVDRVLQLIVDRVRELVDAEYAALGIVDSDGVIEQFITSGMPGRQRLGIGPLPRGHGLLGLIIRENRSYRIPDIGAHPQSVGFPPNHPPMKTFLGLPIRVKGGTVGNFYLTNKRGGREFSPADERLVELFALHAGVAIENARLHEQVRQFAVVDERARIGKDLHDGIIQALYGVGLSLEDVPDLMSENPGEAVARVDRAIDSLNLTIRELRNFIFGLRPELVSQGGLVAGLATLAEEVRLNTVMDVELVAQQDLLEPDPTCSGQLLQIAREALSNIARHSNATRVLIDIAVRDSELALEIADNGRGFDLVAERGTAHLGLANMEQRAAELGGRFEITTLPGEGTRIIARVPLVPARDDAGDR